MREILHIQGVNNDLQIEGVGQVTEHLFIAGTRALTVIPELRRAGVTHVLKLYEDAPYWPEVFTVLDLPLEDGVFIEREVLQQGLSFLHQTITEGQMALVVCGLGISRSATFVLAYLVEQGYDLHDAFRLLRIARPQVWPARELWKSLLTHYQTAYTLDNIESWLSEIPTNLNSKVRQQFLT